MRDMIVIKRKVKKIKKQNLRKNFATSVINHYYFDSGGGCGDVMMVVVLDHDCLLALLPVPRQQHGGVLMEVLADREKENYEEEMTRE